MSRLFQKIFYVAPLFHLLGCDNEVATAGLTNGRLDISSIVITAG
jgi:hypothetical protein